VIISFGWVGGVYRQVTCLSGSAGYRLSVEGVGQFELSNDGRAIACTAAVSSAAPAVVYETLVGPPLVLALALQGKWCLHASAAARHGRVTAFLGDSGRGKSTLSAYLVNQAGWQRVADDILPVAAGAEGVTASPRFPQLKLPPEEQAPADLPNQMPLTAVYLLEQPADNTAARDSVTIERLSRYQAALALIGHTVAARLFDKTLLARHAHFCADAAVPVYRLTYPHRYELLSQIAALIEEAGGD
jgi:hypothetical protein